MRRIYQLFGLPLPQREAGDQKHAAANGFKSHKMLGFLVCLNILIERCGIVAVEIGEALAYAVRRLVDVLYGADNRRADEKDRKKKRENRSGPFHGGLLCNQAAREESITSALECQWDVNGSRQSDFTQ